MCHVSRKETVCKSPLVRSFAQAFLCLTMKKAAVLLLLTLLWTTVRAEVGFSFRTSRIGSLFKMLTQLSQHNPHHPYYALADTSRLFTPALRKQVEAAGDVSWETIRYQAVPESRRVGRSTRDFFLTAAYRSASFAELRERTIGYLPLSEQEQVIRAMEALAPVFDAVVWSRCAARADTQTAALTEYARQHNLSAFFRDAIRFYGAAVPDTMDYKVYINPLPKGFNYFTAQPFQGVLISDMPYRVKRWDDIMAVLMHEIGHVLYAEQPPAVQHKLEAGFLPKTGPARYRNGVAYTWLDETLATIVGNGACYRYLTGRLDTADWYNDPTINQFAKALFPAASRLLEQHRSVTDAGFADTALAVFQKTFPKALAGPNQLLPFHTLIADTLDMNVWDATISQVIQRRSTQAEIPLRTAAYELMENWHGLGIIIVSQKQAATWAQVGKRLTDIPALVQPKNRHRLSATGWYVFGVGKSGRPWLLINPANEADLAEAVRQVAAKG